MSILSQIEAASLRRLAGSLVVRPGEYADLFVERSSHATIQREQGRGEPAILGGWEGAAARWVAIDQVRHASIGTLDPGAIEALPGLLRGSARPLHAGRAGRKSPRVHRPPADPERLADYFEELEGALGADFGGAAFRARGEMTSRTVAVATSEGEVLEDGQTWVSFTAQIVASGPGEPETAGAGGRGARLVVSEGGGAADMERLRTVHPPARVAARLAQALQERLEAAPPPSGEMTIVFGPGAGGILFHEACGHALEGDRALKGRSALVELLGEEVGPPELTMVDDPTLPGLSGSRRVDDEGWPAARNVLIDAGRVVGMLLDRATALQAGTAPTGSARRESYRDLPIPRMSNTFVVEGARSPGEILASVTRGVYVSDLGTGEVDTATADFSFRVRRGYLVAGGRKLAPLRPFVVAGNGVGVLRGVRMVGTDLQFDAGAGECGKQGQRARAAVGQPTIRVDGLLVRPFGGS